MSEDQLITVQDVYNVIAEHLNALDTLWPDHELHGPRKVHIVELIDAIKLRLVERAEKNASRYESVFDKAAKKITGAKLARPQHGDDSKNQTPGGPSKSAMQEAHEAAQARMNKNR